MCYPFFVEFIEIQKNSKLVCIYTNLSYNRVRRYDYVRNY